MRLEFHKQIASDISRIMDYYEGVAGHQLAEEFYESCARSFRKPLNPLRLTQSANAISGA